MVALGPTPQDFVMKKIPHLRFTCAKAEDREKTLDIDVFSVVGTDWEGDESSAVATRKAIKNADVDLIRVKINSPGGFTDDATAIYQQLVEHPAHVDMMVYNAASAATIIAMAGDTIRMAEFGEWMIHEANTCACGDANFFRKIADRLDQVSGQIASLYAKRSGADEEKIRELMRATTWFTAEEAVEFGFVDEVVPGKSKDDDVRIAACFVPEALEQFSNVPERLLSVVNPERQADRSSKRLRTKPLSSGRSLLLGALAPAQQALPLPEGDSPANPAPKEHDMRTIALALALSEDATEAQIVKAINDKDSAHTTELSNTKTQLEAANADRTRLLAATGSETVDAAIGAIEVGNTAKTELKAAQDRLDEQKKEAEAQERERIIAKLGAENRITPAQRDGFCKTVSLETLKSFANDAPVIVAARSEHREADPAVKATSGKTAVTHDGKAYEELTGEQRAKLQKEDKTTFEAVRADWYARNCPTAE